ncbi:MAG TPA: hypothetical protein DCR24_11895 [Bacillus bacterium]|nr:hypothetical protein [Bacillus sp. (in: firmicutes)]
MSKSEHKEMMNELETGIQESLEEMKTSGDFASIKDVTLNKSYSEFTLEVVKETYENIMDGFAVFGLGIFRHTTISFSMEQTKMIIR